MIASPMRISVAPLSPHHGCCRFCIPRSWTPIIWAPCVVLLGPVEVTLRARRGRCSAIERGPDQRDAEVDEQRRPGDHGSRADKC